MALPPKDLHLKCQKCHAELAADERFCSKCGADRELEMAVHAFTAPALASARRWILALGGLYLLGALKLHFQYGERLSDREELLVVGPTLAIAAIHGGLWMWAALQPLAAALVALALFVTLQLVALVLDPSSFLGLTMTIIKVIFLVTLAGAVHAGYKARRIRAEYAKSAGQKSAFDLYTKGRSPGSDGE